ncbi:extracellular solute-binding protein [Herbinix luporum]|uniref:extracellular solute-binding protein n=1 Tax=Herbinix luporum TaxID=1679721 RepID=UPI0017543E5B|nr:extracellular solute-binding protein [Herbinix luporum]HHT57705.1 sugar ABC transporter substrate-binding protein [Herbinix luporum]
MKKFKTFLALILVVTVFAALFVGCGKKQQKSTDKGKVSDETNDQKDNGKKEEKVFTAFHAVPGTEVPDDNRMLRKIAEKIGAWAKVTWLTGQTADERIGIMIAGGEYPDLITGSTGTPSLIEANALIAIDEYWDNYPNIKNYLSEADWNKVRHSDGHIYLIPQFGIIKGKEMATEHWDEAFWIQKKVLIWANFPQIKTIDQYFDLIEDYMKEHPTTADGQETVGFTMSTEDWRYFGIENPPLFLTGYPNDGACIIDPETITAIDYNTIPEAYQYYKKMNEAYNRKLVHPETYTMSYDQYISLLSTGRVLGTLDQFWNFNTAVEALEAQGKFEDTYVPLPITIDGERVDRWHSPAALDVSNGLSITKSCKDIEGALQFINDLLDDEIAKMIYWGEEGVDYMVDENGVFYRTEEQRSNIRNTDWVTQNMVSSAYAYFPHYEGLFDDGINAIDPNQQPGEYYDSLEPVEKELLDGYGYKTFLEFLSPSLPNEPWYPMWSYTNTWTTDTDYGKARAKITELKHEYLPRAMMASPEEFEDIWEEYMEVYRTEVDIDAYLDELTAEARRRAELAE